MYNDKETIAGLFPLPCISYPLSGIQDGILLRFKTFYLKIYNGDDEDERYHINGYRYHKTYPVFSEMVPESRMWEFAKLFTQENYLMGYKPLPEYPMSTL